MVGDILLRQIVHHNPSIVRTGDEACAEAGVPTIASTCFHPFSIGEFQFAAVCMYMGGIDEGIAEGALNLKRLPPPSPDLEKAFDFALASQKKHKSKHQSGRRQSTITLGGCRQHNVRSDSIFWPSQEDQKHLDPTPLNTRAPALIYTGMFDVTRPGSVLAFRVLDAIQQPVELRLLHNTPHVYQPDSSKEIWRFFQMFHK